ncbi:6833_t:CDS:2, partial [Racocetra persica]
MSRKFEQDNSVYIHLLAYKLMGLEFQDILLDEFLSIFGKQFSGKDIWLDSQLRLPHSNQLALLTSYEAFRQRIVE